MLLDKGKAQTKFIKRMLPSVKWQTSIEVMTSCIWYVQSDIITPESMKIKGISACFDSFCQFNKQFYRVDCALRYLLFKYISAWVVKGYGGTTFVIIALWDWCYCTKEEVGHTVQIELWHYKYEVLQRIANSKAISNNAETTTTTTTALRQQPHK